MIGLLAVKLALGDGGKTTNQSGALKTIAQQPFGQVLLMLVAIGLAGYSLWRLFRAFLGHGPEDSDSGLDRIAAFASGIAYAIVFVLALEILLGIRRQLRQPEETDRRRARVAGGNLDRGSRGGHPLRCRALSGLPRDQQGFPEGLEDRADEPRGSHVDHRDRHVRPPGTHGRLRVDRRLLDQGRRRLQPEARRSGWTVRSPSSRTTRMAPTCSGSSRPA